MPRCKNCKEKFTPRFKTTEKYCWDDDCKSVEVDLLVFKKRAKDSKMKQQAWNKEKADFRENDKSLPQAANDVQKYFNEYIRLRDEGDNCISCQNPPKKKNAGHYFNSNNHWTVRFHEDNVHLQCEACNNNLSGNLIPYREHLIKKIGTKRFVNMSAIAQGTAKYTREELKEIKVLYKKKLKALKEARKKVLSLSNGLHRR